MMVKKSFTILILILCFGLIMTGCPKKTVLKEEPSAKKSEETAKIDAEQARADQERKAKIDEEEKAKAEREGFDKSLVAKKEPGIEGQVFESKLLKDIHFDFDKYDVRQQDMGILKENAALLMKSPDVRIQIEGHCDERGTTEYNLALGQRRASSTRNYLVSLGIAASRISIISYGKERPQDPGHTEEAWAKNRRAHTIIVYK